MRNIAVKAIAVVLAGYMTLFFLSACGNAGTAPLSDTVSEEIKGKFEEAKEKPEEMKQTPITEPLTMKIDTKKVEVAWEENESVEALKKLVKDKPLAVRMSMYGGFEQVGSLGTDLPSNDVQITTSAGDIVLYSGDQIVVFFGSNSWEYTRLGKITGKTASEMAELLGKENVTVTIS